MWSIQWPVRLWTLVGAEEATPLYATAYSESTVADAVAGKDVLASEVTSVFSYSLAAVVFMDASSVGVALETLILHFKAEASLEVLVREHALDLVEALQVAAELTVEYRLYSELVALFESAVETSERALGLREVFSVLAESWGLALENRAELETESTTLELGTSLEWQAAWESGVLYNLEITPEGYLRIGEAGIKAVLAVGENNSFVLYESGRLWGWGQNYVGELGVGDVQNRLTPVFITDNVVEVAAGDYHTLIRKPDGTVWATGWNDSGALGTEAYKGGVATTYVQSNITNVAKICAGAINSYFVKNDGTLWACGINNFGQCGGSSPKYFTPVQIGSGAADVAAGNQFALMLKSNGDVYGIGLNNYGQLGNGTINNSNAMTKSLISDVESIACGDYHSLALKRDGTVWAWGLNRLGTLGVGQQPLWSERPLQVPGLSNIVKICAGKTSSFAMDAEGRVYAWGASDNYQLGFGDRATRFTPVVLGVQDAVQVAPGGLHTLFLTKDAKILGVGSNYYGQLSDGTGEDRTTVGITVADAPLDRYGTWLSNPVWLTLAGSASGGAVSWDASGDVVMQVSVSRDGRITWSDWRSVTNGGALSELDGGYGYGGAYLRFFAQFRGKDTVLRRLNATVNAGQVTLQDRQAFAEQYISSLVTSESRASRYMWDILEHIIQSEASLNLKFFEWLTGLADIEPFAVEKRVELKELPFILATSEWSLLDEKVYALIAVLRWRLTATDGVAYALSCVDELPQVLKATDGCSYNLTAVDELLQKLLAVDRVDYKLKVGGKP